MTRTIRGYSLVEVVVAVFILVAGLVPILSLMTGASSELVKARDRTMAMALAVSVAEQLRTTGPAVRVALAPVPPQALPHLKPFVDRYKADCIAAGNTDWADGVDRVLSNFTCSATLLPTGSATPTTVKVEVDWKEAGESRQYTLESSLGLP